MQTRKKAILSWALYDAGNSAFATIVMAGFFPVFFKTYWSSGSEVTVSTAQLGLANAAAGLVIALLAPLLGAVADRGQTKKRFLFLFTCLGAAGTALLALAPQGCWDYAAAWYIAGTLGFAGANIFYDSLLPSVSNEKNIHQVSSLGFALGYLGGGLIFALCILLSAKPELVSLSREAAIKVSFLLAALWWLLLTVPLMLFVAEPQQPVPGGFYRTIREGLSSLLCTFKQVRRMRQVWLFLLAYWFYIDGVDTVIRMAVDYGMSLGFSSGDLVLALLITQFVGFPCALVFGRLGNRWGPKRALYLGIGVYGVIVLWGMVMNSKQEFYLLAGMVGLVQGGVQALSRSFFAGLIPQDRSAQFFGFYNMVGKYSVILGPALMGVSAYVSNNPRAGIASLLIFFLIGGILLCFVKEKTA